MRRGSDEVGVASGFAQFYVHTRPLETRYISFPSIIFIYRQVNAKARQQAVVKTLQPGLMLT